VPAGVDTIIMELIGAGGNGAGNGGGGGGGGAYVKRTSAVTPGTSYSIVVGTGGSELATIVGGMGVLANAGENGTTVANPNVGGGGLGGTGLGGDIMRTGGDGGGGYWTYFGGGGGGAAGSVTSGGDGGNTIVYNGTNCLTPGGAAGTGGGGMAGGGGKGAGFVDANCNVADPAQNGGTYGGGGGGGNGNSSPPGTGSGGICIISWSGASGVPQIVAEDRPVLLQQPFTDRIALRQVTGNERYMLIDATGRTVWEGSRIEEQDLSTLQPGAYSLRVTRGSEVWSLRALKQTR
jgi:hypothetical protein